MLSFASKTVNVYFCFFDKFLRNDMRCSFLDPSSMTAYRHDHVQHLPFVFSHMFQHVVLVDRFVFSHMFYNEAHTLKCVASFYWRKWRHCPMFRRIRVFQDIVAMRVVVIDIPFYRNEDHTLNK